MHFSQSSCFAVLRTHKSGKTWRLIFKIVIIKGIIQRGHQSTKRIAISPTFRKILNLQKRNLIKKHGKEEWEKEREKKRGKHSDHKGIFSC